MSVTLIIDGDRHEGWTSATVTRSLETVAGIFRIQLSERSPGESTPRVIRPGDACRLALDGDQVLSGHVDAAGAAYDAESHEVRASGRDATGDLVDCSAASTPGEWKGAKLEEISATLARPFGIPVRAEVDTGAPFERFRIQEGESVFEAVERGCRFRALLPLSDGRGGLVLARPARSLSGSRLVRGVNILSAQIEADWLDRYSHYTLLGQQAGDDFLTPDDAAHVAAAAEDPGVTRYRPLTMVAEQGLNTAEAEERIAWEAVVRAGRSRRVKIAVQGWRETLSGPLWEPGRLVHVADDWLGLDRELLVTAVEYSLSGAGTVTRLTLMPEDAFAPRLEPAPEPEGAGWWG